MFHFSLPREWQELLAPHIETNSFQNVLSFLNAEKDAGKIIYPPEEDLFKAFELCLPQNTKVVIIGQDPYHGLEQAHGLSFSVKKTSKIPPSLRNIFKALHQDLGYALPHHGDLSYWAQQGVLLLNAILTVEHKKPASHKNKGWEEFTDYLIETLSSQFSGLVFMLWGKFAQEKKVLIKSHKHCILEAPHPASEVYTGGKAGFFGCKHFSLCNVYLKNQVKNTINWNSLNE